MSIKDYICAKPHKHTREATAALAEIYSKKRSQLPFFIPSKIPEILCMARWH